MNKLILLLFFSFLLASCSPDDDCFRVLEPEGNEFTFNCDRYETQVGKFRINITTERATTTCKLQFSNYPNGGNGTPFYYSDGDYDINFVDIWLIIPSENALSGEIPLRTYHLNTDDDQNQAYEIADWNRVVYQGSIYQNENGYKYFNSEHLIGSEFDDLIVDIDKNGDVYYINYTFIKGDSTIRGNFVGEMEIDSYW